MEGEGKRKWKTTRVKSTEFFVRRRTKSHERIGEALRINVLCVCVACELKIFLFEEDPRYYLTHCLQFAGAEAYLGQVAASSLRIPCKVTANVNRVGMVEKPSLWFSHLWAFIQAVPCT